MKRDEVILLLSTAILVELTLVIILAYRFYQLEQPQIAALQNAGSGVKGLLNLFTGKSTATSN